MPDEKNDSGQNRPEPADDANARTPPEEWSREDYAIHARRSELPLFGQAVAGKRDDNGWLSSLSGSIGAVTKAAADPTITPPPTRRSRRSS